MSSLEKWVEKNLYSSLGYSERDVVKMVIGLAKGTIMSMKYT
jgi:hypothetical protein